MKVSELVEKQFEKLEARHKNAKPGAFRRRTAHK